VEVKFGIKPPSTREVWVVVVGEECVGGVSGVRREGAGWAKKFGSCSVVVSWSVVFETGAVWRAADALRDLTVSRVLAA
jgi:hypothetical protein